MELPPFWTTMNIHFNDGTPAPNQVEGHIGVAGVTVKSADKSCILFPWHRIHTVVWESSTED